MFHDNMATYSLIRIALAAARLVRPLASRSSPRSPATRPRSVGSVRRVGGQRDLSPTFARHEQRLPLLGAKADASCRALSLMLALRQ